MKTDRKIKVMGIVNLTDDSFYGESRCADVGSAVSAVSRMVGQGADIIDFGACSTRPGSVPVGAAEEWRRLEPVIKAVRSEFPDIRISVDTYWSDIVMRTYDLIGDFIVNDISSGSADPEMLRLAGRLDLEYVAMHMKGSHSSMHSEMTEGDVIDEVVRFFDGFSIKAEDAGLRRWILDPGFGFSKTMKQNYELMSRLSELRRIYGGCFPEILVGVSRKSMVYRMLDISPEESSCATQALHMSALSAGADILRVHDVMETVHTCRVYQALKGQF